MLTPIASLLLGSAFTYSKMLRDESYVAKGLYWFSQNVIVPRTKYNYLVTGLVLVLIGFLSIFIPSSRTADTSEILWKSLVGAPAFWFLLLAVCVFNGIVGIYRYRSYKRREDDRGQA